MRYRPPINWRLAILKAQDRHNASLHTQSVHDRFLALYQASMKEN